MREAGFDYRPAKLQETREDARNAAQPFGFPSRDDVARAVRGESVLGEEAASIGENDKIKKNLAPSELAKYQQAFYGEAGPENGIEIKLPDGGSEGVTIGGCNGDSIERLYGDVGQWARLEATATYVRIKVQQAARDSAEFEKAVAQWKACAAAEGARGRSPFAAAKRASKADENEKGRLTDIIWDCQRESRLLAVSKEAEEAAAPAITEEFERDILAYRERSQKALSVAERILSEEA